MRTQEFYESMRDSVVDYILSGKAVFFTRNGERTEHGVYCNDPDEDVEILRAFVGEVMTEIYGVKDFCNLGGYLARHAEVLDFVVF